MNRSNRGALGALAIAGGLWAWRNRDKIQSWFNKQRTQYNNSAFTGETRHFNETDRPGYEYDPNNPAPRTYGSSDFS
jgi:hypothetical protein